MLKAELSEDPEFIYNKAAKKERSVMDKVLKS